MSFAARTSTSFGHLSWASDRGDRAGPPRSRPPRRGAGAGRGARAARGAVAGGRRTSGADRGGDTQALQGRVRRAAPRRRARSPPARRPPPGPAGRRWSTRLRRSPRRRATDRRAGPRRLRSARPGPCGPAGRLAWRLVLGPHAHPLLFRPGGSLDRSRHGAAPPMIAATRTAADYPATPEISWNADPPGGARAGRRGEPGLRPRCGGTTGCSPSRPWCRSYRGSSPWASPAPLITDAFSYMAAADHLTPSTRSGLRPSPAAVGTQAVPQPAARDYAAAPDGARPGGDRLRCCAPAGFRLGATLAAALFDSREIWQESSILPDTLFRFVLVVAALIVAPKATPIWQAVGGGGGAHLLGFRSSAGTARRCSS